MSKRRGTTRRRDPVSPIDQPLDAQEQILLRATSPQTIPAARRSRDVFLQARLRSLPLARRPRRWRAARRFPRTFRDTPRHQRQALALTDRLAVQCAEPCATRLRCRGHSREHSSSSVGRTDRAAREHPHAAHECELLVPTDREHLDSVASLAQQQHGCRRTRHGGLFGFVPHVTARPPSGSIRRASSSRSPRRSDRASADA